MKIHLIEAAEGVGESDGTLNMYRFKASIQYNIIFNTIRVVAMRNTLETILK